jgi:predicted nuclease of restriction endonuclease-like (RecB) superfamily
MPTARAKVSETTRAVLSSLAFMPRTRLARSKKVQRPVALSQGLPPDYAEVVAELKARIRSAQSKAAVAVNSELVGVYLHIGRRLAARKTVWGDAAVEKLGKDLRSAFPEMSGFSRRNLFYMRQVHLAWRGQPKSVQQLVARLPWGHHIALVTKIEDPEIRAWYLRQAVASGWSRNMLSIHVTSGLHRRQGKALTNFSRTLPPPQSDLAQEVLKDPYNFDFLTLGKDAHERDLERGLVQHVRDFLVELGVGFAFVGNQVHLSVGEQDFYVDLLFYHLKLRCFIVVELKAGPFEPSFAGMMNFYLSAVDARLRYPADNPSIGLLLCKSKNQLVVEYALRDVNKPIGVAQWETKIVESLPKEFKGSLPTVEQLEAEFSKDRGS